jgi:nucleoside-diphosphate-sugar epimerase
VRRAKASGVSFYRDRRVLVLGGLGFIGRSLTAYLRRAGARVTVVTRSLAAHRDAIADPDAGTHVVRRAEADLRDGPAMAAAVAEQDVVFNLAGQSGAVRSMEDPWTDLDVNVRGNLVLLEAMRAVSPAAKVVFVGSRLEYGRVGVAPVGEDHPSDPLCLHAVHKLAVEQYLRLYGKLFGLRFAVARVTNPYGPGQPRGRTAYGVINRMIHLALSGGTLTVYGDGSQRRDYIYIDDVAAALARLGESPASDGRVYNVGTGVGTRFVDAARRITDLAGSGRVELVDWPPLAAQIETGDFIADISRIRREVGWQPVVALDEGLQRTIASLKSELSTLKSHVSSISES